MNIEYDKWEAAQERDFQWYSERMFKDQINEWSHLLDFFKNDLNQAGKVIVEIGCGPTGGMLKFMKGRLKIGVEPLANRFLEKGFDNIIGPEILYLNSFGEGIPLVNGFADVVCCIHSIGHVQNPISILNETDRVLKDSGRLMILEILRSSEDVTKDHPLTIESDLFFKWLDAHGYEEIRIDLTQTIEEDDKILKLFYGIFEKPSTPSHFDSTIDFQISDYENQIAGGWFDLEVAEKKYRWVSNHFLAFLRSKSQATSIFIEGYVMTDHFTSQSIEITFLVDGQEVGKHTFKKTSDFHLTYTLPDHLDNEKIKVEASSDTFFVPKNSVGNGDDRELSFMVFKLGII